MLEERLGSNIATALGRGLFDVPAVEIREILRDECRGRLVKNNRPLSNSNDPFDSCRQEFWLVRADQQRSIACVGASPQEIKDPFGSVRV